MNKGEILTLFEYNYWANRRILTACEGVSQEQLVTGKASHGSLRSTLRHALGAERAWRMRVQEGVSPKALLTDEDLPTLSAIRDLWSSEEESMRGYLAGLPAGESLDQVVHYSTTAGKEMTTPLWQILIHVLNHGTQTRSEAAMLLTEMGKSPGDLDFTAFLREGK